MRVVGLLLVLCACGRTEPIEPFGSEITPYVQVDGGLIESSVCRQTCPGVPPGAKTPLAMGSGGTVLHWPHCEGCLRVSFDETEQKLFNTWLPSLVNQWDIAFAGGLCLVSDLDPSETPGPEVRQRIHFSYGSPTSVTHEYDLKTGALRSARVVTDFSLRDSASFLLGRAIGLERSTNVKNSVMSYPDSERTSPGTDDQDSLRALYGPPQAWCR